MDKMKLESADITAQNIEKIAELFPNCITETKDKNGNLKKAINFDLLKQDLSKDIVDGKECYEFTWVGKKDSIIEANKPIRKTLRPCKEDSVNWDSTENLYIEGDNLEVLKLLQESYLGKVKLIYIDPPYNTGNDFIYNDDFKVSKDKYENESGIIDDLGNRFVKNTDTNGRFHSDWCSMIYSRLLLARNLLSEAGLIFISINDSELTNLKNICNEIFGNENFIATLVWDKNHSAQAGIYKIYHEYILVYCKNIHQLSHPKSLNNDLFEAGALKKISGRHPASEFTFPKGTRFEAPDGTELSGIIGDTEKFEIVKGKMIAKDKKLQEEVTIRAGFTQARQMYQYFYGDKNTLVDSLGQKVVEFYFNSSGKIKIVKERCVETPQTTCKFGTQAAASLELAKLFELKESPFSSPKPLSMIQDFISRFTNDGDIILDFFSGSATTAHAVLKTNIEQNVNLKYILVQFPENLDSALKQSQKDSVRTIKTAIEYLDSHKLNHNICEIGKERIRRAAKKIAEDNPNAKFDGGFRVFKVDDSNMKDVYYAPAEYSQSLLDKLESNIKEDRTDLDLFFGCILDWGLPLNLSYTSETIENCSVHTYSDNALIACFNDNIPESVIKEIAKRKPLRVVFRDSSFADTPSKINVTEIFKLLSPDTRVKVI